MFADAARTTAVATGECVNQNSISGQDTTAYNFCSGASPSFHSVTTFTVHADCSLILIPTPRLIISSAGCNVCGTSRYAKASNAADLLLCSHRPVCLSAIKMTGDVSLVRMFLSMWCHYSRVDKAPHFRYLSKEYFESSQGRCGNPGCCSPPRIEVLTYFFLVMVLVFVFFAFFSIIILTNVLSEFLFFDV